MLQNKVNAIHEVLSGGLVQTAPVAPLYPDLSWFPPGQYIREEFFDRIVRRLGDSDAMCLTADEIQELELDAVDEIVRNVTGLPTWLGSMYLEELHLPRNRTNLFAVRRQKNGFTILDSNGQKLLEAYRKDGHWVPEPYMQASVTGSIDNLDQSLEKVRRILMDFRTGVRRRQANEYGSTDWRDVYESGGLDILGALKERYGNSLLLQRAYNPPFCLANMWIGEDLYAAMLVMMKVEPELLQGFIEHFMPLPEHHWEYLKKAGIDVIMLQEFMTGAEVVDPQLYAEVVLPSTGRNVMYLQELGFKVILYYCGKVIPVLKHLQSIPFDALAIEEDRKGYTQDIGQIRTMVGPQMPLLGNLPIELLEEGTPETIEREVKRQIAVAGHNAPFLVSTGSPPTQKTSRANFKAFCNATRQLEDMAKGKATIYSER